MPLSLGTFEERSWTPEEIVALQKALDHDFNKQVSSDQAELHGALPYLKIKMGLIILKEHLSMDTFDQKMMLLGRNNLVHMMKQHDLSILPRKPVK